MSLNFPPNPSPGDLYTIGTTTFQWNGTAWVRYNDPNKTLVNLTVTTVIITGTSITTGPTSGALIVNGGVGIQGDLYLGGVLYSGGEAVLTTATFGGTINAGNDISITEITPGILRFDNTSTLDSVTKRGSTTTSTIYINNLTNSTSTNSGALIVSGGIGVGKDLYVKGTIYGENLKINNGIIGSNKVFTSGNSIVSLDTYSLSQFRSAKYIIQILSGTGTTAQVQVTEVLMLADNDSNVFLVEYGSVTNFGVDQTQSLGDFSADYLSGTVTLYFTPFVATTKEITVVRTAVVV